MTDWYGVAKVLAAGAKAADSPTGRDVQIPAALRAMAGKAAELAGEQIAEASRRARREREGT